MKTTTSEVVLECDCSSLSKYSFATDAGVIGGFSMALGRRVVAGLRLDEALRNCGWWAGVKLRVGRFGTDRFLSSLGVEDRSCRIDATEDERETGERAGEDFVVRGVLNCVRKGDVSTALGGRLSLLLTSRNLSLRDVTVLAPGRLVPVCSLVSTDGSAMSGSWSILSEALSRVISFIVAW